MFFLMFLRKNSIKMHRNTQQKHHQHGTLDAIFPEWCSDKQFYILGVCGRLLCVAIKLFCTSSSSSQRDKPVFYFVIPYQYATYLCASPIAPSYSQLTVYQRRRGANTPYARLLIITYKKCTFNINLLLIALWWSGVCVWLIFIL